MIISCKNSWVESLNQIKSNQSYVYQQCLRTTGTSSASAKTRLMACYMYVRAPVLSPTPLAGHQPCLRHRAWCISSGSDNVVSFLFSEQIWNQIRKILGCDSGVYIWSFRENQMLNISCYCLFKLMKFHSLSLIALGLGMFELPSMWCSRHLPLSQNTDSNTGDKITHLRHISKMQSYPGYSQILLWYLYLWDMLLWDILLWELHLWDIFL